MTQRSGVNPSPDFEHTVERNALFGILHQLHAEDQSSSSHISDKRMRP